MSGRRPVAPRGHRWPRPPVSPSRGLDPANALSSSTTHRATAPAGPARAPRPSGVPVEAAKGQAGPSKEPAVPHQQADHRCRATHLPGDLRQQRALCFEPERQLLLVLGKNTVHERLPEISGLAGSQDRCADPLNPSLTAVRPGASSTTPWSATPCASETSRGEHVQGARRLGWRGRLRGSTLFRRWQRAQRWRVLGLRERRSSGIRQRPRQPRPGPRMSFEPVSMAKPVPGWASSEHLQMGLLLCVGHEDRQCREDQQDEQA